MAIPFRVSRAIATSSLLLAAHIALAYCSGNYYGTEIGEFTNFEHGIRGKVYVVDAETLFIAGFHYDGAGPDAYFWIGEGKEPDPQGVIVPFPPQPLGTSNPLPKLKRARGENVLLRLPKGFRVWNINYLSVWCREFRADFGHVLFQGSRLKVPRPGILGGFKFQRVRSGDILIPDDRTIHVPGFFYGGQSGDVYLVASFEDPRKTQGLEDKVLLINAETGSAEPIRFSNGKTVLKLELPEGRSLVEFNTISVRKSDDTEKTLALVKFNSVGTQEITPPPSLNGKAMKSGTKDFMDDKALEFTNCIEPFRGSMQVRWKMAADRQKVLFQMMGKLNVGAPPGAEYMAFGLSGAPGKSQMVGGDVAVAYYNTAKGTVVLDDYFLSAKAQCDGRWGVCPDQRLGGVDDLEFLSGEVKDGITVVHYMKPVVGKDAEWDAKLPLESKASVIAAMGQLSDDWMARYHGAKRTGEHFQVNFAMEGQNTCGPPLMKLNERKLTAPVEGTGPAGFPGVEPQGGNDRDGGGSWKPAVLSGVDTFAARIGPTGGSRGYSAITGHPSWGVSWWINGHMIPELHVVRGKTYKFIVEGGNNFRNPAQMHPFYITDSPEGGFGQKKVSEREGERIFAGVRQNRDGKEEPTARGRFCRHEIPETENREADAFPSLADYEKSTKANCERGSPGELIWHVAPNTPDVVYYQCYIHKNMGWKIIVEDGGLIEKPQAMSPHAAEVDAPKILAKTDCGPKTPVGLDLPNCVEPLSGLLQVRWKLDESRQSVEIQMAGKIREESYMAFGVSGSPDKALMSGGDVAVAYTGPSGSVAIRDFYLGGRQECDGVRGVCPDVIFPGGSDRQLQPLSTEVVDGVTVVRYRRPVAGIDKQWDKSISTDGDGVAVIAAMGELNAKGYPKYHGELRTGNLVRLTFGDFCGEPLAYTSSAAACSGNKDGEHDGPDKPVSPKIKPTIKPPLLPHPGMDEVIKMMLAGTGDGESFLKSGLLPSKAGTIVGYPFKGTAWWIGGRLIPEIHVDFDQKIVLGEKKTGEDPYALEGTHPRSLLRRG